MNPRATEAFLKRLIEIIDNITILSSSTDWHELMGHTYDSIGESIALVDDNITRFEKLFDLICDAISKVV
jgi:hypothetical protein